MSPKCGNKDCKISKYYESTKAAIDELCALAYKYGDKPHQLFSCIRRIVLQFEKNPTMRKEAARLMDLEYENIGHKNALAEKFHAGLSKAMKKSVE